MSLISTFYEQNDSESDYGILSISRHAGIYAFWIENYISIRKRIIESNKSSRSKVIQENW
jgi:hypothetical protein